MATPISLNLPQAPLSFANVSEAQQELLVAIYVGAFNRAPEYEGLLYWAAQLGTRIAYNESQYDALKAIGREMYAAGASNGEGGTQVDTTEFVRLAYQNSLGRNAASEEIAYWANEIDSGKTSRGEFITPFLDEALKQSGDSEFLQARVGVAQYMAQQHVSGPNAPGLDAKVLSDSIATVKDEASALAAIDQIAIKYGTVSDDTNTSFESNHGEVDVHLLPATPQQIIIDNFERNLDQFGLSSKLAAQIGSLSYVGEPDTLEELHTPEYFTGVAGQVALIRDYQLLVIDLNGDGRYEASDDLSVSLPGVFQLEHWNFVGSDEAGPTQSGTAEQAGLLPSTPNTEDVHTLSLGDGNLLVKNFETSLDRFAMSADLKALIGKFTYTGEPDNQEELHSPEYFTGIAGQAALLRDSQLLVIDVDGDGTYNAVNDITISLPGVFQLEDWNFIA